MGQVHIVAAQEHRDGAAAIADTHRNRFAFSLESFVTPSKSYHRARVRLSLQALGVVRIGGQKEMILKDADMRYC
jgi:hypothetical protein